jgi:uroporphyrinogen-III synthase
VTADTARPVAVVASEETSTRWAQAIRALGLPAAECPWSEIVPPADPAVALAALSRRDFDLVLVNSSNAVRFLPPGVGTGLRAAAVGRRSAFAAKRAGFDVVLTGNAGAESVARRLVADAGPPRRALHLRGEDARRDAERVLSQAGWTVTSVVAYRNRPRPDLAGTLARVGAPSAWVVGSPAAAAALRTALGEAAFPPPAGGTPVVVPGETTAAALRAPGRAAPVVAPNADPDGIAAAVRVSLPA